MSEQLSDASRVLPRSVYLDTQFVFAYLVSEDEDHQDAAAVARQLEALVAAGFTRAFLSVVVLDELAWKLGGVLYDRDTGAAQGWRQLSDRKKEREYRQRRAEIAEWLLGLLRQRWIAALAADEEVCRRVPDVIQKHGLRPADACHLACAARHNVRAILTNDRHFTDLAEPPLQVLTYRGQTSNPGSP